MKSDEGKAKMQKQEFRGRSVLRDLNARESSAALHPHKLQQVIVLEHTDIDAVTSGVISETFSIVPTQMEILHSVHTSRKVRPTDISYNTQDRANFKAVFDSDVRATYKH